MDNLLALRAYRKVVESAGFSRAAEAMDLTPGTVSRLVSQLEQDLGARLLQRSTRKMSLTEAGKIYYEHCARVLDELEDARREVHQLVGAARGNLLVSMPASFGILAISHLLPEFLNEYPEIRLDVVASDQFVDLFEGGFDLALRISKHLPDSSMVAKPIADIDLVVAASPAYFRKAGKPAIPQDLAQHNCLLYTLSAKPGEWTFTLDQESRRFRVKGNYQANSSVMLREALIQGVGVTQIPRPFIQDLLRSGQLVTCLDECQEPPHRLFAMLPQQRAVSPKVRAFIEFIARHLGTDVNPPKIKKPSNNQPPGNVIF